MTVTTELNSTRLVPSLPNEVSESEVEVRMMKVFLVRLSLGLAGKCNCSGGGGFEENVDIIGNRG